jgi:hypothetical protein
MTKTPTQGLSPRALGWLRYIWDKATTPDDWSDRGEPHPWWDRYCEPPMCSFPRFDLPYTAYVLPVMIEATPAWREAYVRIADEVTHRYTTFWGAVDWNTLIGPDPGVDRYPPEMLALIPEKLRGRYAPPGWTGNGIEPWGLQPDPIGADGNVFYRGWLNLLLGMRRYVSGKADQDERFDVTGYRNRQFTWTHARIAALISAQFAARPQGPHCENTKIWPFCVSATGLGLKLYDALLGTTFHAPFPRWVEYVRKHYMEIDRDGNLAWFVLYYDPIEQRAETFPHKVTAYSALTVLLYLYPQDRAFAEQLYTLSMRLLAWSDPSRPVLDLVDHPLNLATALFIARELGDSTTEARLREVAETKYEPHFFGAENDRFAFGLGIDSEWPRGQVNSILMLSECSGPGAWWRVFNEPNVKMHNEPTVCDVDYPNLGIRRAQNDMVRGVLEIETIAATPSRRGTATQFTVKGLPDPANVVVTVDDQKFTRWHVTASDAIRIETDVHEHQFRVAFRSSSPPKKADRIVSGILSTAEPIR